MFRIGNGWKAGSIFMEIATTFVFAAFAYGAYAAIKITITFMLESVHLPVIFLHSLLATGLFALFVMTAVGNSVTAFSAFFRSEELEYLFTLPLDAKKIFIFKFAENFFRSSTPMFLLGGAALLAYGRYFDLSIYEYLLIIIGIVIPFIFTAAGLGTLILYLIVRISILFSPKLIITTAILLTLIGSGLYFQSVHPVDQVQEIIKYYPNFQDHPTIAQAKVGEVAYVPSTWVASALFSIVDGNIASAFNNIAVLILSCIVLVAILYNVSGRGYYKLWLDTQGKEWLIKKPNNSTQPTFLINLNLPFSKRVEAFLKRDFLMFIRDPSQWGHMILFLVLLLIFIANMSGLTLYISDPVRMTILFISNYIFGGFFLVSLAVRFVFPLMSQEGQAFWMIKSAPLSMRFMLSYKGIISCVILLSIGLPLLGITSDALSTSKDLQMITLTFTILATLITTLLSLATGAWFANLKEKSAIRAASSRGATVAFLVTMFYLVGGSALLSVISLNIFKLTIDGEPYEPNSSLLLLGVFGIISIIIAVLSVIISKKALEREEVYAR